MLANEGVSVNTAESQDADAVALDRVATGAQLVALALGALGALFFVVSIVSFVFFAVYILIGGLLL
jgi:hypothetical protein